MHFVPRTNSKLSNVLTTLERIERGSFGIQKIHCNAITHINVQSQQQEGMQAKQCCSSETNSSADGFNVIQVITLDPTQTVC